MSNQTMTIEQIEFQYQAAREAMAHAWYIRNQSEWSKRTYRKLRSGYLASVKAWRELLNQAKGV